MSVGAQSVVSTALTQAELDSLVSAAIAQWAAAGSSASQIASLYGTSFTVADLTGTALSETTSPGHVSIDIDAAGHGWFIDPTPLDNLEFPHAQDAAGTRLLADPTSEAAGHIDLLTVVTRELGHALGLNDSLSPGDADDLMYFNLLDGERRIPDAIDIALAPTTNLRPTISVGPVTDAGHGGGFLFGDSGADDFMFAGVDVKADRPVPVTHVTDYHFAEGDSFDFSTLTSQFHASGIDDNMIVRAVEDPSGSFATLQVNKVDPSATSSYSNWVSVAQIHGAHAGDPVNVLVDSHSAVHLAQIHVGLLV